jgi:hypothetical protein
MTELITQDHEVDCWQPTVDPIIIRLYCFFQNCIFIDFIMVKDDIIGSYLFIIYLFSFAN